MPGHRRSALLLHGLNELDRRWILARLPERHQEILGEHLNELKELGIPAERLQPDPASSSRQAVADEPLQLASAAQMQTMLHKEPGWLVHQVLALEQWPWAEDFLALLGSARSEQLRALQLPELSGMTRQTLRTQLNRRLAQVQPLQQASPAGRPAQRQWLNMLPEQMRKWL